MVSLCSWGKRSLATSLAAWVLLVLSMTSAFAESLHLVYTSDQHYGITRKTFRGQENASATNVNAAMVQAINSLPGMMFPNDGGVDAGKKVGWADVVISTGDIANRMEGTDPQAVATAAQCWNTFNEQYTKQLSLTNGKGKAPLLLVVPGNHDVTNAVGFHRPMVPATDASSVVAMYNKANNTAITPEQYVFEEHKVLISKQLGGVHLLLAQMWPDTPTRAWLAKEIAKLPKGTPVLLFTHDQPDVEAKHFRNPNGDHSINGNDKFENLLSDTSSVSKAKEVPVKEHRNLANFLQAHPNIVAYFHGNENYNEFYEWKGPDNTIAMPVFRVDSSMKGNVSSKDETKLSFQFVSIDTATNQMTVREVLWNATPEQPGITWGESKTIPIAVAAKAQ